MSDAQFEKQTVPQLKELLQRVDAAIAAREVAARTELKERFRAMAEEAGLSIDDVLGTGRRGKLGKAPVKFRNPKAAGETWSGRGRIPRWLSALLKGGAKLDDFRV